MALVIASAAYIELTQFYWRKLHLKVDQILHLHSLYYVIL